VCRLLTIKSETPFAITPHLKKFAAIAKNSKEFQGHGWGCAYLDETGGWEFYKNINPVWQDEFDQFGETTLLVVHARSAFEDRDIIVENNMPFFDSRTVFIFNGELRGVKIRAEGRIGAEKIFNYIRRFDKGDSTGWHRHGHDYVVVPLMDGQLKLVTSDGEMIAEMKKGAPYFREEGVEHDVVNATDGEYAFIEVELK